LSMRILHTIPNLSGGGAERQLSYLAPELVRMGHDVHIAYSREGPHKPDLVGVELHQLKSRSNYDPYLLLQLVGLSRRIKPDIIHTWIRQMDVLGAMAATLSGIPWVLREPSEALSYPTNLKNRLRVLVASSASVIVCNSRGGDEYWKAEVPHSCRAVISNAVPIDDIERTAATSLPGLVKSDVPIVLYVGRMEGSKRVKALLEALACIRRKQEVLGVFCGEGSQRSELEVTSHNLGLEAVVQFLGHLPTTSIWALMKKASVFVSLSAYEGCPNAVMEAMVCSCPLVLSDTRAHREILDDRCALFVDPLNIQQTTDTIVWALRNVDASKGRALIAKQKTLGWSIAEMARHYERVYRECI
jgi:glycosyltransferase involved in cell wall biosynthesis